MENAGLADDILLQILLCLPVKSLLRFRCVSKSWKVLISSNYFAKLHLNRSRIHRKPLGLIWKDELISAEGYERMHIFVADCSNLENSAHALQRLHQPFDEDPGLEVSTLIGSCNGLLCLLSPRYKDFSNGRRFDDFFVVVNPLTRRCSSFNGETGWYFSARSSFYGFGYDDVHDDYKVVTWGVRPKQLGAESDCSKFEVYSVTNASWSTRISGLTNSYVDGISCGVLVNCTLHWIAMNNEGKYCIVAFDLRIDEHRLMETPEVDLAIPKLVEYDEDEYHCRMELGVLNGSLCGIVLDGGKPYKLDLWVMKEYGMHDSWIKITIDMSCYQLQWWARGSSRKGRMTQIVPILHMENKKQLILYSYVEGFLVYDMVNNRLCKVIKIPEFDPKRHHEVPKDYWFVSKEFCFQGSLVELPGFDSSDAIWDE